MLHLNKDQLIELAEAMARYGGHGFSYIQNVHPSIKSLSGKWHHVEECDWIQLEYLLGMKISKLPPSATSLRAVTKIRNFEQLKKVITQSLDTISVNDVMNNVVHEKIAQFIMSNGAVYNGYDSLPDVLQLMTKRHGRVPEVLAQSLIELESVQIFWPQNQYKLNKDMGISDLASVDGTWVLKDPEPIMIGARFAFQESQGIPLAFVNKFHQMCASSNLCLATKVQNGKVEQLPSDVKQVLLAAFALGQAGSDRDMFNALMQLKYIFSPVEKPRFTVPPKEHLKKMRALLKGAESSPLPPSVAKDSPLPPSVVHDLRLNELRTFFSLERADTLHDNVLAAIQRGNTYQVNIDEEWSMLFPDSLIKGEKPGDIDDAISQAEEKYRPVFSKAVSDYSATFLGRFVDLPITESTLKTHTSSLFRRLDLALRDPRWGPEDKFIFCSKIDQVLSINNFSKLLDKETGYQRLQDLNDEFDAVLKKCLKGAKDYVVAPSISDVDSLDENIKHSLESDGVSLRGFKI